MKFLEHIDLRYKMTTAIGYSLFEMQVNLNVIKELNLVSLISRGTWQWKTLNIGY